jgi:hypothetical protein
VSERAPHASEGDTLGGSPPEALRAALTVAGVDLVSDDDLLRLAEVLHAHRARFAEALAELDLGAADILPPFDPRWA